MTAPIVESPRSGLLIDGRDYYRAVYDACLQAKRTILLLGWQFDTLVELLRGDDAEGATHPIRLLPFLTSLCEERPELRIYILTWASSPVFVLEREPFQWLRFRLLGHRNIRFEVDDCHPVGASQHQKAVIVDRSIAMLGGMDLCRARWDDRTHLARDPRRGKRPLVRKPYKPYHDVQAYVTGEAVDVLRDWFVERWQRSCGERLDLPDASTARVTITPTHELAIPRVTLARTVPDPEIRELRELHARAIAMARSMIYIENQYFSSEMIRRALIARMHRPGAPLDIVIVLPRRSGGLKEQIAVGVRQSEILRELKAVAQRTGHHVGVYYVAAPGDDGDVPVFIHAKVLSVDDRFLLVSSCNTTNRSLGLDTELGVAWEHGAAEPSIRAARRLLLAEHTGLAPEVVPDHVRELDELAHSRAGRLRMHEMREDDEPGRRIALALRDDVPLDPGDPNTVERVWRRLRGAIRPAARTR